MLMNSYGEFVLEPPRLMELPPVDMEKLREDMARHGAAHYETTVCPWCKREFVKHRKNQTYCCRACCVDATRKRKKVDA